MNQKMTLIAALLACVGQGLHAEDFAAPATTAAVTVPVGELEPYIWPVAKKVNGHSVKVVSKFGRRKVPAANTPPGAAPATAAEEQHTGVDFSVPVGTNIRAARSGKVIFAGFSSEYVSRAKKSEKSHLVIIKHADGQSSRYVHLDRLKVRYGMELKPGDVIGTSSASDEWSDPVLHFEIKDAGGKALDPLILLADPVQAP